MTNARVQVYSAAAMRLFLTKNSETLQCRMAAGSSTIQC